MNRKRWLMFLLCILLVLAGCSSGNETVPQEEDAVTDQAGEASDNSNDNEDRGADASSASNNEGSEQVADTEIIANDASNSMNPLDPDIWIKGNITVEDDKIIVEGSSNLPGEIEIRGQITAKGYTMVGYRDQSLTENDGSYRLELKRPDILEDPLDVKVFIKPEELEEPVQEVLGATGEKMTGPHVLQYLSNDDEIHYEAGAIGRLKPGETQAELEAPTGEAPDDLGSPVVWIEPTVTFDDENYYVAAKSNLVEGTEVNLNIDIPDKIVTGYTDRTNVGPDGTFMLQIKKAKNVDTLFMLLRVKPDEYMWPTVKEAYGENGEKLEGDLVKTEENSDEGTKKYIEVKVKVNG